MSGRLLLALSQSRTFDSIPELMEIYPEAKVIFVGRDAQEWWDSIAALSTYTNPLCLGVLMAPIPGWRYLAPFANEYNRSMLRLAGLTEKTATPVDLMKRGRPHILEAQKYSGHSGTKGKSFGDGPERRMRAVVRFPGRSGARRTIPESK